MINAAIKEEGDAHIFQFRQCVIVLWLAAIYSPNVLVISSGGNAIGTVKICHIV